MIKGKSFTAILSRVTVKEICEGHQTKKEAKKKKTDNYFSWKSKPEWQSLCCSLKESDEIITD